MRRTGGKNSIVVVGPGAMGCLLTGLLLEGGADVALLDHRSDRADYIDHHGIALIENERERLFDVRCTADARGLMSANLIIVMTKAYATWQAIVHALPLVGGGTLVLTLQNGLGNYQCIAETVPIAQVLAGSTTAGASLLETGRVLVASRGETAIASPQGTGEGPQRAAAVLSEAGLVTHVADDVDAMLWRKALLNAAVNPLTALTRRLNRQLLEDEGLRALMGRVAEETYAIGNALGIGWGELAPAALVEGICRSTARNKSSMLQDVEAGRRTEIDNINGYIVGQARQAGIDAPLNELLTNLVRAIPIHG